MPATRETALRLLRDAILGPCAVRDRWAIDTLRAAGAAARYAVVQTVRGVYSSELAASSPHPVILERCLYLLGIMGHPAGIEPVEKTLSAGMGPTGARLVQTIQATGDLAHREPVAATGLVAWAERRLGTAVMDEELAMAAIHAAVACRKDPATWITTPLPDTDAVKAMSAWAVKVRADPLLPRRTPV